MRALLLALTTGMALALAAPAAQAQFGDLFRSLSGALRGRDQPPPQQQGVTPVLGVRGMDEVDAKNAASTGGNDYNLMEGWSTTRPEAERAAAGKGLAARPATLRKDEKAERTEAGDGGMK